MTPFVFLAQGATNKVEFMNGKTNNNNCNIEINGIRIPIGRTVAKGKVRWVLDLTAPGGPRQRKTFASLEDARTFARSLATDQSNSWSVLAGARAGELKAIAEIAEKLLPFLAPRQISLDQAIAEYCAAKRLAPTTALDQLVAEYLAQPWATKRQTPFLDAVERFLADKQAKNCSYEHLKSLKAALRPSGRLLGNPPLGSVTTAMLRQAIFLPNEAIRTSKWRFCGLHNFYSWLRANGYLRSDVPTAMDPIEPPKVPKPPVAILTPDIARKALKTLVDTGNIHLVIPFALGLFTGTRTDERSRLTAKQIEPGHWITVPANASKTKVGRTMPILPVLDAWLQPFYDHLISLSTSRDPQMRMAEVLKAVGITWGRNWLRHSYCSYRLAGTRDIVATAQECGHSPYVLQHYYLGRVTEEQAKEYFELTPNKCGIGNWPKIAAAYLETKPLIQHGSKRTKRGA